MMLLLFLVFIVPLCAGNLCPKGKYWSHELEKCNPCSKCEQSYLLRPCEKFNDTVCADEIKLPLTWFYSQKLKKDRLHFIPDRFDSDLDEEDNSHHHKDFNDLDDDDDDFVVKKEKHYRFNEDEDEDKSKHKKHKKHYSFKADEFKRKKEPSHKWWMKDSDTSDFDENDSKFSDISYEKLEKWLVDSKNELKHRKDNLLKTLKGKVAESKKFKLNHPNRKMISEIIDDLEKHELHAKKEKNRPKGELDLNLLRDLVRSEKVHADEGFFKLLSNPDTSDPLDYKSIVPTHRLFLGEPSTVSEIIGQEPHDAKPDHAKNVVLEKSKFSVLPLIEEPDNDENDVLSVPFSSAETLVWDWQAVSLVSAVGACLLFFVVAAIYILLSSRETKRVKISDHDAEEMTTMVALMPPEMERSESRRNKQYVPRPIVISKQLPGNYVHSKPSPRS